MLNGVKQFVLLSVLLILCVSSIHLKAQNTFSIIKDTNPGTADANPGDLYVADDKVYFLTEPTPGTGNLWVSSGIPDDAELLLEFTVPLVLGAALDFEIANDGKVYFTLDETTFSSIIYVTDGTVAGTMPLARPEEDDFNGLEYFFILNNEVYFMNYEAELELWKTDGTASGTVLVKNFCSFSGGGNCYAQAYNNNTITILNGEAYFFLKEPVYGQELWITDGSPVGTRVIDFITGPGDFIFDYQRSVAFDGKVYFQSSNGNGSTNSPSNTGDELHVTDGTLAGTSLFKDINTTSGNGYFNLHSRAHNLYSDGNKMYFFAIDGVTGDELYISDGTASGTQSIGDILPGNVERGQTPQFYAFNNKVLFNYSDSYFDEVNDVKYTQLWSSDGTVGGTSVLKQFNSVYSPFDPEIEFNNELFFKSRPLDGGREIWKTDGTENGTVRLKDINPGNGHDISSQAPIVQLDGLLYFIADDGNGAALWQTDGTEIGTYTVTIPNGIQVDWVGADELVVLNDRLIFLADINGSGLEVWSMSPGELTAIQQMSAIEANIYPNPATKFVQFTLTRTPAKAFDLQVVDVAGKVMQRQTNLINQEVVIPLGDYVPGIYLIQYLDSQSALQVGSWKLIVVEE